MDRKVFLESMECLLPQRQGVVEMLNRAAQNFFTSATDYQKGRYNLETSINDFLIYYNDRELSTTKVVPFRAMMNVENKDLVHTIRKNTIKRMQRRCNRNFLKTVF